MFEPKNEQGTIIYFQQVCEDLGLEIVDIRTSYPDATIVDTNTGKKMEVEFEFNSDNFKRHQHDPKAVDLIICWHRGSSSEVPVFELSTMTQHPAGKYTPDRQPKPRPSPKPFAPDRWHTVLVVDGKASFHSRNDGKKVMAIFITDGKSPSIEADIEDTLPSSRLLIEAVKIARDIRLHEGKRRSDSEAAKKAAMVAVKALDLRRQEGASA